MVVVDVMVLLVLLLPEDGLRWSILQMHLWRSILLRWHSVLLWRWWWHIWWRWRIMGHWTIGDSVDWNG